jgi:hypothetical protein
LQKKYVASSGSSDESSDSESGSESDKKSASGSGSGSSSSSSSSAGSAAESEDESTTKPKKTRIISSDSEPEDAVDAGEPAEPPVSEHEISEEEEVFILEEEDPPAESVNPLVGQLAGVQREVDELINKIGIGAEVTVSDVEAFTPPPLKSPTYRESPGGVVYGATFIPHPKPSVGDEEEDLERVPLTITPPATPKARSPHKKNVSPPKKNSVSAPSEPTAGASSDRNYSPSRTVDHDKKSKKTSKKTEDVMVNILLEL